jgi:hypothetical protein
MLLTMPPFLDVARPAARAGKYELFVLGDAAGLPYRLTRSGHERLATMTTLKRLRGDVHRRRSLQPWNASGSAPDAKASTWGLEVVPGGWLWREVSGRSGRVYAADGDRLARDEVGQPVGEYLATLTGAGPIALPPVVSVAGRAGLRPAHSAR